MHTTASLLSPAQQAAFKKEGYLLHHKPVFTQPKFDGLKSFFEVLLEKWMQFGKASPEHMDVPHFAEPKLFDWLLDDQVLDLVEPLIGPDIALFSSHFICKPPKVGKRVPWHEDSAYWKGRLAPMEVVTVWLAIDPSNPDNGCMRVIPGSHANGFSDYTEVADPSREVFGTEVKKGSFDESKAVDCTLAPNTASLHHAKLIHGSHANTGVNRRCGYTMRFMPTTVKYTRINPADPFQVYLARGKDHAGNIYADPTKPNQGWLDKYPDGWPAGH